MPFKVGVVPHDRGLHESPTLPAGDEHIVTSPVQHADGSVTQAKLSFGTWEKLADVTLGANSDYIEFTGLNINIDMFYAIFLTVKNPLGSMIDVFIFVEGDYSPSSYAVQICEVSGTSISANRYNMSTVSGVDAGERSNAYTIITRDPGGYAKAVGLDLTNTGAKVNVQILANSKIGTVANITKIRLQASSSNGLGAGSKFLLARMKTK